jgi:hypothetical protein
VWRRSVGERMVLRGLWGRRESVGAAEAAARGERHPNLVIGWRGMRCGSSSGGACGYRSGSVGHGADRRHRRGQRAGRHGQVRRRQDGGLPQASRARRPAHARPDAGLMGAALSPIPGGVPQVRACGFPCRFAVDGSGAALAVAFAAMLRAPSSRRRPGTAPRSSARLGAPSHTAFIWLGGDDPAPGAQRG